jgi:pimeloyl-ACP methyl ester carboxylesterase
LNAILHKLWAGLKFMGRWLGPVLVLLAAWLFMFPFSPFLDVSGLSALVGGIISAIAWFAGRKSDRVKSRRILASAAVIGLAYFAFSRWNGQRGYHTETVRFDNRGAHLVGTLYLPDRPGKVPGIVWVHGGGPLTRQQNSIFATHFARAGYAMFMYDKRGIGDSTGYFEKDHPLSPENLDLLASDASAALSMLANRPEVRADMAGFVGASQGGWTTPRAAVLNGHAAFMLLLSGSTASTHSFVRYESFHLFHGRDPGTAISQTSLSVGIKSFGQGNIPDGMSIDQAAALAQKVKLDGSMPDFDPMVDLRALNIPGLWLVGDKDWTIPSGPTMRNLDILRKEGKPYEYRNIPGGWHAMIIAPKRLVLDTIDTWLARVTAAKH